MCLIVNSEKPVAETDLFVHKIIEKYNNDFFTPFQKYPIQFKNGQCHITMNNKKLSLPIRYHYNRPYIHEGIHGYYKIEQAEYVNRLFYCKTKIHYAIIPKGCEYYLGVNCDIVSTDMIVFRTREDYRKYKREHEVKRIK